MNKFSCILLIVALLGTIALSAQRRVSPVNNAATATQHVNETRVEGDTIDRSRLISTTDPQGRPLLIDTITGREFVDSVAIRQAADTIPKMIYPLLHSATFSVDIMQPVMRAFGQHYGLIEFGAEINLHNRYIPVFEAGLGQAKNTPDDNNFTYRSPVAPFFRIGLNYNFLYNSNPDYMFYAGVRYGFSPFKWSITDISQDAGYWDEPISYEIPSQSATAGFFEFLLGLRVKIWRQISLGWAVKFHSIIHESHSEHGKPWYIPGYGSRNGALTASFSVSYTLPLHKKPKSLPANSPSLPADQLPAYETARPPVEPAASDSAMPAENISPDESVSSEDANPAAEPKNGANV